MEISINNNKLKDLLEKKKVLIEQGIGVSQEIEDLEGKMESIDKEIQEIEKGVDVSEIEADAQALTDKFNALMAEMETMNKRVREHLAKFVPENLKEEYESSKKLKESLEEKRNKIALEAQKYNDKIIPIVRKELKPHLKDEFDDFGSVQLEDGEIKGVIFNHVEDFKEAYRKRKS